MVSAVLKQLASASTRLRSRLVIAITHKIACANALRRVRHNSSHIVPRNHVRCSGPSTTMPEFGLLATMPKLLFECGRNNDRRGGFLFTIARLDFALVLLVLVQHSFSFTLISRSANPDLGTRSSDVFVSLLLSDIDRLGCDTGAKLECFESRLHSSNRTGYLVEMLLWSGAKACRSKDAFGS